MEKKQDRGQEVRAMWRALFVLAAIPKTGSKSKEELRSQLETMLLSHGVITDYLEPKMLERDLEELHAIFGSDRGGLLQLDDSGKTHRWSWSTERAVGMHPSDAARGLLAAFNEDWETTGRAKKARR